MAPKSMPEQIYFLIVECWYEVDDLGFDCDYCVFYKVDRSDIGQELLDLFRQVYGVPYSFEPEGGVSDMGQELLGLFRQAYGEPPYPCEPSQGELPGVNAGRCPARKPTHYSKIDTPEQARMREEIHDAIMRATEGATAKERQEWLKSLTSFTIKDVKSAKTSLIFGLRVENTLTTTGAILGEDFGNRDGTSTFALGPRPAGCEAPERGGRRRKRRKPLPGRTYGESPEAPALGASR